MFLDELRYTLHSSPIDSLKLGTPTKEQVQENIILLTSIGSEAFSVTEEGDNVYGGVNFGTLMNYWGITDHTKPKWAVSHWDDGPYMYPMLDNTNSVVYEVRYFLEQAYYGHPKFLELLFIDEKFHVFKNDIGQMLIINKHLFLHYKCKEAVISYAHTELKYLSKKMDWYRAYNTIKFLYIYRDLMNGEGFQVDRNKAGDADELRFIKEGLMDINEFKKFSSDLILKASLMDCLSLGWVDTKAINDLSVSIMKVIYDRHLSQEIS